jgi:hypothetical protein
MGFFEIGSFELFPGMVLNHDPPNLFLHVARIIGGSQGHPDPLCVCVCTCVSVLGFSR